jgi:prophage regulatory protein
MEQEVGMEMPTHAEQDERFIKLSEVSHLTAMSGAQIYALIRVDKFPRQIKLGIKSSAWKISSVRAWMDSRQVVTNCPNPATNAASGQSK